MSKNNNKWPANTIHTNTAFVIVMALLAVVPLLFSTVIFELAMWVYGEGALPQSILLAIFSFIFLVVFFFYAVLVHSLAISNAHLAKTSKKQTLMHLFKHMRSVFWRVAKFDFLGFIFSLPPIAFLILGYGSNPILSIIGWVWLVLYPFFMLWTQYYLVNAGLIFSIKKSFSTIKNHFIQSVKAYIVLVLMGVLLTIAWMATIWTTIQSQVLAVQNGVALMNLFTFLYSVLHVFPIYFLRGGGNIFLQAIILLLHVMFIIFGISYLFSAAPKKTK